jgi:dienelactone hydrolase
MFAIPSSCLRGAVLAIFCGVVLQATLAAQTTLPQLQPGPYPVAHWDWDFGPLTTTHPSTGAPLTVNNFGRMSYPSDGSGGALPPLATGSFPVVVFGHGRFGTGPNNHLEAAYLMDHLASWGIVATSVSLDVVGQFSSPAAIPQRGDILLETMDRTLHVALQPGTPPLGLAAGMDPNRLGLAGHSRGGEGVADALVKNAAAGYFPILAAATISPTDFEEYTLPADVPYLGIYGSKDGDVNNGWPIFLHDRGAAEEKVFEYVEGANHFWFTESLQFFGEGNADISRNLHHHVARAYIGGFLVQKLVGSTLDSRVFADGSELDPLTSVVDIHPMYRHPSRFVIDDFESNSSKYLASSGGQVFLTFPTSREASLDESSYTFYHETTGALAAWPNGGGGTFAVALPNGSFDATSWEQLSLKFTQRFSASLNSAAMDQDVTLSLRDADGDTASLPLSNYGRIPFPITHNGSLFQNFPKKSVLRTTRLPLADFVANNPALDLDRLAYVAWTSATAKGELEFDDLEFSK